MRACFIREFGGTDKVQVGDVKLPVPANGEALVRVRAASLNHLDLWVLKGRPGMKLEGEHVLGSDASGTVVALGDGAHGFAVNDEVLLNPGLSCGCCERCREGETSLCEKFSLVGVSRAGTFAELVTVPVECLWRKPSHLSFEEAACVGIAYLTAWRMLFTRARLKAGETVLIHGIGGGVATAALQLVRLAGGDAIVTSSSLEKLARARSLGAAAGIDYKKDDVAKRAKELTGARGVDVVFDTVGAATLAQSQGAVRRGGRIVTCGVTGGVKGEIDVRELYWNQVELIGSTMGTPGEMRLLMRAVESNRLKPVIDTVRPLSEGKAALEQMERGAQLGKLVLKVS
ncbi:zinc-binding dehydrogenase [bacterium]|nr:zinc-binding dehydrogenase [bacterium]